MLTEYQQSIAIKVPCFALSFLVEPDSRDAARKQMEGFSDSAIFHRWMSLTWTFDDADAVALLTARERRLLDEFSAIFDSIHWIPVASHPFISEAKDDELKRLTPVASQLLQALRSRS